ncbi:uncharacterized protein GLRG_05134, partial [Colletotrichum graminicola M1.001]
FSSQAFYISLIAKDGSVFLTETKMFRHRKPPPHAKRFSVVFSVTQRSTKKRSHTGSNPNEIPSARPALTTSALVSSTPPFCSSLCNNRIEKNEHKPVPQTQKRLRFP